jgi:hypothetical protein
MSTPFPATLRNLDPSLRAALPGLLLATLTLLFGMGLGVIFGLNEDAIKSRLSAAAAAAPAAVYQQDAAAIKVVLDKSWVYMQRAHLHGGSLGTIAVVLTLLVVLLGTRPLVTRAISLGLGAGGLGYSVFWLWAGFRAAALGSTGAAKESLKWLAMPSSGAVVVATIAVGVLLVLAFAPRRHPSTGHATRPLLTAH